ncbi:MAG TPA: hypothetical protein VK213_02985, partial [Bacteroidales bacterium]|nr:hypothetical protein [Bacteroidales bacterium]
MKTSLRITSWSGILVFLGVLLIFSGGQKIQAQAVKGVGISEDAAIIPDKSAVLELQSIERGLLVPRMTTIQRNNIFDAADGLIVFDTDTKSLWYYDKTAGIWKTYAPGAWAGTANQVLGITTGLGGLNEYKSLIGTPNRVVVTPSAGQIQFSTPQDIHTLATPVFAGLTINGNATITGNTQVGGSTRLDGTMQFGAAGQQVNNIQTAVRTTGTAEDTKLVTEKAVRDALINSVSADNGLHESSEGNIQLGGDLINPLTDIGVETGTVLTISNAAEAAALSVNDQGNITIGNGTITTGNGAITTGTGQVTVGGNINANSGIDITGGSLTIDNQAILQTTGGQVTFAGNVDAGSGVDVTGDVNVSNNTDINGTLDVAGSTSVAAPGVATTVRGTLDVNETTNLDGAVTAGNGI